MRWVFGIGSAVTTGDATSIALASCIGIDLHAKMRLVFVAPFVTILAPLPVVVICRLRGVHELYGAPLATVYRAAALIGAWLIQPAVLRESFLGGENLPGPKADPHGRGGATFEAWHPDPAHQPRPRLASNTTSAPTASR